METFDFLSCMHHILNAYSLRCQSLCKEIQMPQTAFDILMFLANNPGFSSARDITEIRGIKANLVSVNVEKLVRAGYLERHPVPNDRRKIMLRPTQTAQPIIRRGHQMQQQFIDSLLEGVSPDLMQASLATVSIITQNAVNSLN